MAVIIDRRVDGHVNATAGELKDVTNQVKDGYLYWDVPEGIYRIYTITRQLDACTSKNDYINLLEPESVKLLIDAVYEPHYARYKEEFGNTIAGFFSDESGFYNSKGEEFDYTLQIGADMPLPWSEQVLPRLSEKLDMDALRYLPCLWYDCGLETNRVRHQYMNLITSMYQKNFTQMLGDWCAAHHVEYTGHVLEDDGVHTKLGAGHYFRAMKGQHIPGIDVVLRQIVPGNDYDFPYILSMPNLTDGEFYHYGLAKLGSSAAHVDTEAKGRCMCEIFGAYGWSEGISLMKWLTDFMLVRGVNYFVPHAFSQNAFPDMDCPPHFYARGNNPQYPYMDILFGYMNRMSHLLSGGRSAAQIAVLYHAEGEWTGGAMPYHKVGKVLMQHQIDYDVLSMDYLRAAVTESGMIKIGNAAYRCLVVPAMQKFPGTYLEELAKLIKEGIRVYFVNRIPEAFDSTAYDADILEKAEILTLDQMAEKMAAQGYQEIKLSKQEPHLMYYRYELPEMTVRMFHNENVTEPMDVDVTISKDETLCRYDALENRLYALAAGDGAFHLHLAKWESAVFLSGRDDGRNLPKWMSFLIWQRRPLIFPGRRDMKAK